nr:AAA family ATPase [uncultured Dysosmobacter sp.]
MTATDIHEVLRHFDGVKRCNENQYMAHCPCHDDRKQSLSIGRGQKGVVLKCQAGCDTRDIIACVGLKPADLFYEQREEPQERPQIVAIYNYPGGVQKLRYSDKHFRWRQPDGKGGWVWNRKGVRPSLYIAGELTGCVAVAEGEKDADNLHRLGWDAVSGADGAGPGKWKPEYTEQLRGIHVCIFQDNDRVGKDYAQETAAALHGVAASVRVLDLSSVWTEIPEHGDVSDLIAKFGDEKACELIAQLITKTPEWEPTQDPLFSLFKSLEDFPEEEAKWLVPGWIPAGQISVIAADGGIGKTTLWCHIIAALSNGTTCILDPPEYAREPMKIMFLTTEDSVRKKLRKKLRLAGANMKNIITPDFVGDRSGMLHKLKFGSEELEKVLRHFRPALCVFDPIQGFTPPKVNMGSRNEMRDCTAQLITIGEDTVKRAFIREWKMCIRLRLTLCFVLYRTFWRRWRRLYDYISNNRRGIHRRAGGRSRSASK